MKSRLVKVFLVLGVAGGALAVYFYAAGNNSTGFRFRTTGTVEATEYSIAPEISGKLTRVAFREGDRVEAGDLVAELSSEELSAELDRSSSAVRSAAAVVENSKDILAGARAGLETAKAEVERADSQVELAGAAFELAEKDHARAGELFGKGIIPQSELDRAVTGLSTARAELSSAKAALAVSESNVNTAAAAVSSAESALAASRANLSEAKSAVRVSEAKLDYTRILSPSGGVVEYRVLEPGEVVSPGRTILTLVDPSDAWVRIDVDERYVHDIKEGTKATVSLEYAPGKTFRATVYDIGREAGFATERDVTRGRQDIRTFRVRLRFDDPDGTLKPGMTVVVTFLEE